MVRYLLLIFWMNNAGKAPDIVLNKIAGGISGQFFDLIADYYSRALACLVDKRELSPDWPAYGL